MIWEANSAGPIIRRESTETISFGRGDYLECLLPGLSH